MKKCLPYLIIASIYVFNTSLAGTSDAIPTPSFEHHWYAGGGVTYIATTHFRISSFPNGDIIHNSKHIGFETFIGAQANEYFSGELGYSNLNKWVFNQTRITTLEQIHFVTKLWNLHLIGIARYPIIKHTLYLFALAGMAWFNTKFQRSFDASSGLPEQTATLSVVNLMYGAGTAADFGRWGIRLMYSAFKTDFFIDNQPPAATGATPYLNYLTLSLIVKF